MNPLILCHVACSGGSVIFRKLCQRYGLLGLSEVSPYAKVYTEAFSPFDPEATLFGLGILDQHEFEATFADRIRHCHEIAERRQQRLLIRDHTDSHFFRETEPAEVGFSWFAHHAEKLFPDQPPKALVSVRNPIDSWLGLRQSFSHIQRLDFEQYCQRYLQFWQQVKLGQQSGTVIKTFRYEDFIESAQTVYSDIEERLPDLLKKVEQSGAFVSSGNSGRQSNVLSSRARRSFTTDLLRAADRSPSYAELTNQLGYPHIASETTASTRAFAHLNWVKKRAVNTFYRTANWARKKLDLSASQD